MIVVPVAQIEWLMPGTVRVGDLVECGGSVVRIKSLSGGVDWTWGRGAPTLTIDARNGAVALACGVQIPVLFLRENTHYLIGQNGFARIRGPNTRAAVEKLYGPPSRWATIGLRATFTKGVLTHATVTGRRGWVSNTGIAIGDSLAEAIWLVPGVKRIDAHHWRIATRLVALVRGTLVTGFVATTAR